MSYQIHGEHNGTIYELTALGDITVRKTLNDPSSMTATFLRDKMTVENDDAVAVQLGESGMDDVNLFYGYVQDTVKFDDEVKVTAYDQLFLMKLIKEIKVYGNKKVSDLLIQVCREHKFYMVDPPIVADTEYEIPDVIADGDDPHSMVVDGLNITTNATGKEYFVYDFFRNICLGEREALRLPKTDYELNEHNIQSYSLGEDSKERINEVVVKSNDQNNPDNILAVRRDEASIDRKGAVTITQIIKDGENADVIADELFKAKTQIKRDYSVTVYGINAQAYPGRLIHVDLFTVKKEYVRGWFLIEEATYTLSGGRGMTDFKLTLYEMEDEAWTQ